MLGTYCNQALITQQWGRGYQTRILDEKLAI